MSSSYPESDRWSELADRIDEINAFLDFLEGTELEVAEVCHEYTDRRLVPYNGSRTELVARYFGIDLRKLDRERRRMLAELQERAS